MNLNTESQEKEQENKQEKKKLTRKQKIIIAVIAALILLAILLILLLLPEKIKNDGIPTLTVATPPKQSISAQEEFSVDVELSDMGEDIYPAASVSIVFDSSRLEFMGIGEGNIMISGDERADGNTSQLPEWSVDVERSNKIGQINIMYLDMTGGKYAFSKEYMNDKHILMRLNFRLRGSAEVGDIYNLEVIDAVFAATDENNSLASINDTLITENGKVVAAE